MKDTFKFVIAITMCILMTWGITRISSRVDFIRDRIDDKSQVTVEEPRRLVGKWQIVLYQIGIFPPKTIKTNEYFVKDKIIWYKDAAMGDELPVPEGATIIPDDNRDIEEYGVYDVESVY